MSFNNQAIFRQLPEIARELFFLNNYMVVDVLVLCFTNIAFYTEKPLNGYRTAVMCIETSTISTV